MVTNNERRAVAARLRELPTDMYEVEELWEMKGLDTCCKDQTDYYLIHFVLFGCFPADYMHPCDYEELHMRLAYLIEPEPERTCRNVGGEEWGFKCSECGGHTHGSPFHAPDSERDEVARRMSELFGIEDGAIASLHGSVPRYCPNCGAKVVE